MNEKHNIDRLFQEKFKDFEVAPPEFVWENIREELQEEKKTTGKVTPLWLRLSGVAALLLLGGLLATLFFNDAENPATNAPAVVVEDQNTTPANTIMPSSPDVTAPTQAGPSATGTETGTASQNNTITNNNTAVAVSEEAAQNNKQNSATQTNSSNQRANSSATGFGKNNNNAVAYDRNAANKSTANKNNRNGQMQNNNAVAGIQNGNNKSSRNGINTADNNGIVTNSPANEGIATTNGKTAGSNTGSNSGVTNAVNTAQRQNGNATSTSTEGIAATDAKSSGKNAGSTPNNGNTIQKQNGNANTMPVASEGIAGTDSTNPAANSNLQKQNAANGIASANGVATANGATTIENASGTNTTSGTNDPAAKGNVIIDKNIPVGGEVAQTVVDTNKVVPQNELEKLLEEKLKGEEKDKELAENKKNKDRWNIRPQVAPVFYNSLSAGSPINEQLAGNSKSYDNDLSYGLGINYAVTDRISIRSGINSVNLNYSTNDIAYYASLNGGTSNIGTAKATGFVIQPADAAAPDVFLIDGQSTQLVEGSMIQKTGYIEIPLEMSYALVNNKFGVDLIGGVSSLFLNENNVSVVSSTGMSTEVGKAQNLNNLHFSTNLGVGFKYKFWDSFQASFEPTFKYQVNAYSRNAGNFKPYFVGLYSGVSFSF